MRWQWLLSIGAVVLAFLGSQHHNLMMLLVAHQMLPTEEGDRRISEERRRTAGHQHFGAQGGAEPLG